MTYIGTKYILIPKHVKIKIKKNWIWMIGPKGILKGFLRNDVQIYEHQGKIFLLCKNIKKQKLWGTYRTLLQNMVEGVIKPFKIQLILKGLGFKFFFERDFIIFKLDSTHYKIIKKPKNLIARNLKGNVLELESVNLQKVTEFASKIRHLKKPDKYKGKGFVFKGEVLNLKEGKKN